MKNGLGATKVVGNKKNSHTTDEITKNINTKILESWCFEVNSV